jgi:hypothetical protein
VGSEIGWIIFGIGMLVLLLGGLTAAAGLQRHRVRPTWVIAFTAALGVGILAGNLFALQSAVLSVPVLGIYAAGWIAFGLRTRRGRCLAIGLSVPLEGRQGPHRHALQSDHPVPEGDNSRGHPSRDGLRSVRAR